MGLIPWILRRGGYLLFVILAFTIFLIVFHPEQSLSKQLADCQMRLQYLESMYRARQEDEGLSLNGGTEISNITINGSVLGELNSQKRIILKNTTVLARSPSSLQMPNIFNFLPHLLDDPSSLRPSFLMSKGRTGVQFVFGVPTVKRNMNSYLIISLHNIISNMDEAEQTDTLIIVFIGETDMNYVSQVTKQIEDQFASFLKIGLIEVIDPAQSYYPDMNKLRITLNDSPEQVKWRSKQNLDYSFLMAYAQPKGTYYVQLEDDIFTTRGFISIMKKFALQQTALNDSWLVLDFCKLGFIGKMFKSAELPWLITFLQMFYNDKPVDWLLDELIDTKVCRWGNNQKCIQEKAKYWIHYNTSLFQHIGEISSLNGKIQKLKDDKLVKIPDFYPHHNPPATVKTGIESYKNFYLNRAYKGETYFWGVDIQPGDLIEFIFNEPINLKKYNFRCGTSEYPFESFYNTTIEILPTSLTENSIIWSIYNTTTDGFLIVGSFTPFGLAEGLIDPEIGPIKELRLHLHSEIDSAILSEKMFNRPRCRDWTPLATQQLRLRNLIKVTGENINCNARCQLYYTLHSTTMSAPFFTSEKIEPLGSNSVNWPEINCQIILKSTAKCICIRVWEHLSTSDDDEPSVLHSVQQLDERGVSPATDALVSDDKSSSNRNSYCKSKSGDKMLFIWGVYFSGLVVITKRSEARFHPNSLVFQMHGGYFASPESLLQETIRQQLTLNYKLELDVTTATTTTHSNYNTNSLKIYNSYNSDSETLKTAAAKSCDMSSNLSTSNIIISSRNSLKTSTTPSATKTTTTKDSEFQINSPRNSRSCSPVRGEFLNNIQNNSNCYKKTVDDDKGACTNLVPPPSISKELLEMIKIRYLEKNFHRSELRPSYNLEKLLKLQEKQRKYKYKSENAKEICDKICMKSAFCLNLELISNKGLFYRPRGNPSMGRTLNRLLFQETPINPEDILKAQDLRRKIETARFRSRLLLQERDKLKMNIRHLETKLGQLHDNNIDLESCAMSCHRNLSRDKEALIQKKIDYSVKREYLAKLKQGLQFRRSQLCSEIKEIYPIRRTAKGNFSINGIILPNAENLPNHVKLLDADYVWEPVSPLSLSVALGYVTHVVQMCSIILNLPLRNSVIHEGSRSRIVDMIKDLPNSSREEAVEEYPLYAFTYSQLTSIYGSHSNAFVNLLGRFPLYSRTNPPPKAVLYAIYLLNQNIAQLSYQISGIKCDLRATLPNLLQLLNGPTSRDYHQINNNTNEPTNMTSISGSSVDLNVPLPPLSGTSKPVDFVDMKMNDQRISRSVGSYSEENLPTGDEKSGKNFHSSEPILAKQVHLTNFNENGDI